MTISISSSARPSPTFVARCSRYSARTSEIRAEGPIPESTAALKGSSAGRAGSCWVASRGPDATPFAWEVTSLKGSCFIWRVNRRLRCRNGHRDSIVLPGWQRRDQIGNMPVLRFKNCRLGAMAEGLVLQHAVDGAERYPCWPKILWRRRERMSCEPRFGDEAVDEDLKRPAFDYLGNVVSARRGVVPLHLADKGNRPVLDSLVDFVKLHHTHDSQHPTQRLLIDTRAKAEAHVSGAAGKRSNLNESLVEKSIAHPCERRKRHVPLDINLPFGRDTSLCHVSGNVTTIRL